MCKSILKLIMWHNTCKIYFIFFIKKKCHIGKKRCHIIVPLATQVITITTVNKMTYNAHFKNLSDQQFSLET